MRYEGKIYRPPSEAHSYILQATIGCSWNKCTYCDMYRQKEFRVRDIDQVLADVEMATLTGWRETPKVFVADGDALILPMDYWRELLPALRDAFPRVRRVSCYAMATNILEKTPDELAELRAEGLSLLYIGPESGDDMTLKRIAKGSTHAEHVEAARRAKDANLALSAIFLLGVAGTARSHEHAVESARLATAMDPEFLSALTVTVIEDTPLARAEEKGHFEMPDIRDLLVELRTFVEQAQPTRAIFRTNHASNYLPIAGTLPKDRETILAIIGDALSGDTPLRPEWSRGL